MITGIPTIRIASVSESVSAATQTPNARTLVSSPRMRYVTSRAIRIGAGASMGSMLVPIAARDHAGHGRSRLRFSLPTVPRDDRGSADPDAQGRPERQVARLDTDAVAAAAQGT